MQPRFGFDVRIDIKQDEEGWWGLIYVFQYDPNEPPLLVGPCESEEDARRRATTLAKDVAPPSRD
jgi:hypothetical protein